MAPPRRKAGKPTQAPEPVTKALAPMAAPHDEPVAHSAPQPEAKSSQAQMETKAQMEPGGLALNHAREAFVRLKQASEETSQAFEASYKLTNSGLTTLGLKAVEALKATSDHHFAFWNSLMGLRSPSEALSLHSDYVVKQFANLKAQTSDLVATAQQIALESSQPLKATLAKTIKPAV